MGGATDLAWTFGVPYAPVRWKCLRRRVRWAHNRDEGNVSLTAPTSVRAAEEFSRTRLSQSFFMRDFLFSEIAAIERMSNLSDDPELAIQAGRGLCENLLEPLQATFGRLAIRSAYRSPEVNDFGCKHRLSCASNEKNRARHTWDRRDKHCRIGAVATVVVPWLVDRMVTGISWQSMAWWVHDNLSYSELQFFPKLYAFNIGWHEVPKRTIHSFVARAFSPNRDLPTTTVTTAICTPASRLWSGRDRS
jgi:hypothetical protein